MSRQTNDVQRLVFLVQRAFAPAGAKVTESAEIKHHGTMREIDVLVEAPAGLYTLKIAVEVKDEKRKLGPQVVEEYIGKYQPGSGIPMSQVVLVSSSGFTRSANDRARAANMLLMTISEAKHADWRKFISPKTPQALTFEIQPHFHARRILPPVPDGGERVWVEGRLCCTCCGRDHGTPKDVLGRSLQKDFWSNPELKRELDEALVKHDGNALATVRVPIARQAIHFLGHIYPIQELVAEIHFCRASGPLEFQTFELEDASGSKTTFQRARARVLANPSSFCCQTEQPQTGLSLMSERKTREVRQSHRRISDVFGGNGMARKDAQPCRAIHNL